MASRKLEYLITVHILSPILSISPNLREHHCPFIVQVFPTHRRRCTMSREAPAFDLETGAANPEVKEQNREYDETTMDQLGQDTNIVDWDGPDDSANPLNWSSFKSNLHVIIVSVFTLYALVIRFSV